MRRLQDLSDGARMQLALELLRNAPAEMRSAVLDALAWGYLRVEEEEEPVSGPPVSGPTARSLYVQVCEVLGVRMVYLVPEGDGYEVVWSNEKELVGRWGTGSDAYYADFSAASTAALKLAWGEEIPTSRRQRIAWEDERWREQERAR